MPKGRIVKALSGYYYVLPEQADPSDKPIQCRARGIFKKKGLSPLVGDWVDYELTDNGEGTVDRLHDRSSELVRPPMANADLAVLVFSVTKPEWNTALLDKFLVHTESAGLDAVIVVTKTDLLQLPEYVDQAEQVESYIDRYRSIGYTVLPVSAKGGIGVGELLDSLSGRCSVLAGQSGVGKSSLVNALVPGLTLETNEISMRLGRGRHTTRHVELIPLPNGGLLADTPGFSQLDFLQVEAEGLSSCFIEFQPYSERCKFRGCLHSAEPKCMVADGVEKGEIDRERYEHYLQFLTEIQEKKRRY